MGGLQMTEPFERRGALISMEHWCVEKPVEREFNGKMCEIMGERIILEDWIEFKNPDGKVILKMQFFLWREMGFELQGRLLEELRKLYG